MSLRIPSLSSAIGLMAVVLLSACGTAGGAGGAASGFIGGQPGQICQPKYQDEGCANVNGGGFEKVKCDATDPAKPVWATLGKCATSESCREVAQKTPANTPMKTAECYLYQAVTPTGTADATSGDSKSGGDTKAGDTGTVSMDGSAIMACAKTKCASLYAACQAAAMCKAAAACTEKCKDISCMAACPQDESAAYDALGTCIQTQKCVPAFGTCGDGLCANATETKANCPADCGLTPDNCGNGKCDAGESSANCPPDCPTTGPKCGNGTCESGESSSNCPADCPTTGPKCGNGMCESGESTSTCPADCKTTGPVCGNGTCESGESPSNCAKDCKTTGAKCGDMNCSPDENCPVDCNSKYTNLMACMYEGCTSQYTACANDPKCISFFNCNVACNCDKNCESGCQEMAGSPGPALLGLGQCAASLSCSDPCPSSGPVCGNSICESSESPSSCPKDCKTTAACGNGKCESGETASNCPPDCGTSTGHFCDANCGKGNGTNCYCDATCMTQGDCCNAAGTAVAGKSCAGSTCGECTAAP